MKSRRGIAAALALCALLFVAGGALAAPSASSVSPVSVKVGAGIKAEFFGVFPDGRMDPDERYSDITELVFEKEGIAEAYTERGVVFIRGIAEGTVSFTATSASAGTLSGSMTVIAADGREDVTFKREGGDIVVPARLQLYTGQAYAFPARQAAFAITSVDSDAPASETATLGYNRGSIVLNTQKPGLIRLYVRDNLANGVAACDVTVTDLTLSVKSNRDLSKPLKPGSSATLSGTFSPKLTDEQLKGAKWISFEPEIATVDPQTGTITAKRAGLARIFLYLPLTGRYYGIGVEHRYVGSGTVSGVLVGA